MTALGGAAGTPDAEILFFSVQGPVRSGRVTGRRVGPSGGMMANRGIDKSFAKGYNVGGIWRNRASFVGTGTLSQVANLPHPGVASE